MTDIRRRNQQVVVQRLGDPSLQLGLHEQLGTAPHQDLIVVATEPGLTETMVTAITGLAATANVAGNEGEASRQVAASHRRLAARSRLLRACDALTSGQVAARAGSRGRTADRWRRSKLVFSVDLYGTSYYPSCQFGEDGRPLPAMKDVLAELRADGMDDWDIAGWFRSPNPWLGRRCPADLVCTEPAAVTLAASHHAERGRT